MQKTASNIIRTILSLMVASVILTEVFWTPNVIAYVRDICTDGQILTILNALSVLITCLSVVVFLLAFKFADAVEHSSVFSREVVRRLKLAAGLIVTDCAVFGAVAGILLALGEKVLAPVMVLFDVVGIAIAVMLFMLSRYIDEAAALKEEADLTL